MRLRASIPVLALTFVMLQPVFAQTGKAGRLFGSPEAAKPAARKPAEAPKPTPTPAPEKSANEEITTSPISAPVGTTKKVSPAPKAAAKPTEKPAPTPASPPTPVPAANAPAVNSKWEDGVKDCPSCKGVKNPHHKEQVKCPPMPKAITGSALDLEEFQRTILQNNARAMDVCNIKTVRSPGFGEETMRQLKMLSDKLGNAGVKSDLEVDSYFRCYMNANDVNAQKSGKAPSDFCHYQNELAPAMKWAAKVSGISYAVFACKMYREGSWRPKALSIDKAMGYAQFMPGPLDDMNSIVLNSNVQSRYEAKLKKLEALELDLAERENPISNGSPRTPASSLPSRTRKTLMSIAQIKRDISYTRRELNNLTSAKRAQDVWNAYWQGTPNAPKKFSRALAACPSVAFIASVAKQVYDASYLDDLPGVKLNTFFVQENEKSPYKMMLGTLNNFESSLYSAGVYNGGWVPFIRYCPKGNDLNYCIEKLRRSDPDGDNRGYSQIVNHMKSIQNCATANNWKPMDGTPPRNCNTGDCK